MWSEIKEKLQFVEFTPWTHWIFAVNSYYDFMEMNSLHKLTYENKSFGPKILGFHFKQVPF